MTIRLGLSTCPNDTFLFAPLLDGRLDGGSLDLEFVLADVQELNEALLAGRLDVSKVSFATALRLAETHGVLPVGSALGFGVGPVLLAARGAPPPGPDVPVLCPGADTTATLLLRCLHPTWTDLRQVRFDRIMPALVRGEASAGVCIHEGRFTYREQGLELIEDLGESWERSTGLPVPLGGLVASRGLSGGVVSALIALLRRSLDLALAEPEANLATMRAHAQELEDDVIWRHVELYVNAHTRDLGQVGAACLAELARRAGQGAAPRILG